MALERGKLSNVVQVAAGNTVGIITCASSKKVYIKSIICHASGTGINTATAQVLNHQYLSRNHQLYLKGEDLDVDKFYV